MKPAIVWMPPERRLVGVLESLDRNCSRHIIQKRFSVISNDRKRDGFRRRPGGAFWAHVAQYHARCEQYGAT